MACKFNVIVLKPRATRLACPGIISVPAVRSPNVCSILFPACAIVAATLGTAVAKSPEDTANLFATSFTASTICSESAAVILNAFIWEIKKAAASPALTSSSATFWNIEATSANWRDSISLKPDLVNSVAASITCVAVLATFSPTCKALSPNCSSSAPVMSLTFLNSVIAASNSKTEDTPFLKEL